jgi:putative colanic acid biosynthesis UDP-glucose lipid carrier transferase
MVNQRSVGIRGSNLACQVALVTASFWGWLFIWQSTLFAQPSALQRYLLYCEFLLVGIVLSWGIKPEGSGSSHDWVLASRRSLRQALAGLFSVLAVVFALQDKGISRSFFFSYIPWLFLTLLFSNYFVPRVLAGWLFSGIHEERVALVGTMAQAGKLRPWLERKSLLGLRTVGVVSPDSAGSSMTGGPYPALGILTELDTVMRQHGVTQVVVLDITLDRQRLRQVTELCESAAVRLLFLNNLDDYFQHATASFEDDGVRFISLREEPLESPVNRFWKRLLDLAVALPVTLIILPITTLLVWLLQRYQSPGPVLFVQTRVGIRGRPFKIYKYRTMGLENVNEARQACKEDPRVYPAGRWLRKFSIDELPQFLNVLLGDMSVVGPRPHLPRHEEIFICAMRKYLIRKFIRPGITGWAQVNGFRGEIHQEHDIQRRVEADIYYLENWAFSFDCWIILRTIKQCLRPPGSAY